MIYVGDCREVLRTLPDESVHCCVTSPPYWGLRDYGLEPTYWPLLKPPLGPDVAKGIRAQTEAAWYGCLGLEPTPQLYVEHMVEVFREVRRVLRGDGTCWLNLGDSYATGSGGDKNVGTTTQGAGYLQKARARSLAPDLKPKDLCMIPARVALALQADGWYLRSEIIWSKPNPMPESVKDRPTKAHEQIFLLAKSERYFFNQEAVAEKASSDFGRGVIGRGQQASAIAVGCNGRQAQQDHSGWMGGDGETRNIRSVWTVATQPYPEAHFATFPEDIAKRCILAGCPEGGTVLDPFAGSGTVGAVAESLQCKALLIEAQENYLSLIEKRISQGVLKFA